MPLDSDEQAPKNKKDRRYRVGKGKKLGLRKVSYPAPLPTTKRKGRSKRGER